MQERLYELERQRIPDLERQIPPRRENLFIPLSQFREKNSNTINIIQPREQKIKFNKTIKKPLRNLNEIYTYRVFEENINSINITQPRTRENNNLSQLIAPRERLEGALRQFALLYPTTQQVAIPRTLDNRQISRIGDTVDGLAVVREAFSGIPEDELVALLGKVEGSLSDITGQERAKLVKALFSSPESNSFASEIQSAGLKLDQLPDLILDEGIFFLVSTMLTHPDKYRMQLGLILSQVNLDQIPKELKDKLKPHMSVLEFSIKPSHESWYLCNAAERKLVQSVDEAAVMALGEEGNPYFLLKFRGKLSALCLQDVTTKEGKVFVKGNWYSLTDGEMRDALRVAFEAGQGRADLQKGSWALMRPLKPYGGKTAEELVEQALHVARSIPDVYPSNEIVVDEIKLPRQDYRRLYKEEY